MQRWILHVDMDAFFAAIEQRDAPALRGQPVVVGAKPGGRGVVATCSYEARRYGIRSAMPIGEAHRRCPQAVYLRPRMAHYAAVSRQVLQALRGVVPAVEPVSIDEAYADVSGLEALLGTPEQVAARVKRALRAAVDLPASVGIGPNRLIAKLASEAAKPDGLRVVRPEQVADFLAPLPVGALRGVGPCTGAVLARLGLTTVASLRATPLEVLQGPLGLRVAQSLHRQARGEADDRIGAGAPRKSISKETTFPHDVREPARLREALRLQAGEVARTARAAGLAGRVVTLKIRFAGFATHTRRQRLAQATASARVLLESAWRMYGHSGLPDRPVRLVGVGLAELGPPEEAPPDLFGQADADARERAIANTLDRIQARFGPDAVHRGVGRKPQG